LQKNKSLKRERDKEEGKEIVLPQYGSPELTAEKDGSYHPNNGKKENFQKKEEKFAAVHIQDILERRKNSIGEKKKENKKS
jgi:hypothetical protein